MFVYLVLYSSENSRVYLRVALLPTSGGEGLLLIPNFINSGDQPWLQMDLSPLVVHLLPGHQQLHN